MKINFVESTFLRFIFFGGINTIFAYLILALFLYFNFHYMLATLIAAIISIFSGFYINKIFVFNIKKAKSILIYYLLWFIYYLINIFIQFIFLEILDIKNLYFNSFISTIFTVILSFFINKFYVFKESECLKKI